MRNLMRHSSSPQSMAPPAVSTSPEHLEMNILEPHPRTTESETGVGSSKVSTKLSSDSEADQRLKTPGPELSY